MDEAVSTQTDKIRNDGLKECVLIVVGFLHESLSKSDRYIVVDLFRTEKLLIIITMTQTVWSTTELDCRLNIIAGTEYDDEGGSLTIRKEYKRTDLMKMMYGIRTPSSTSTHSKRTVVILTEAVMKYVYISHLLEPFALEFQLLAWFGDHLNAAIASGVVESKQDSVD